jgi:CheY-like chemotaxis protein
MPGFEVLRVLRGDQRLAKIPVVVFTSQLKTGDLQHALMLGADSFMSKPLDFSEFVRDVESIKKRWLCSFRILLNRWPIHRECPATSPARENIWRTPHAISPKPIAASNMRNQDSLTSLRKPMQIPNSTSAATSLMIFGANL